MAENDCLMKGADYSDNAQNPHLVIVKQTSI